MQDPKLLLEQRETVNRFLQNGRVDAYDCPWEGGPVVGGAARNKALRESLIIEVRRRMKDKKPPAMPAIDSVAYTRNKVDPMVRGLFPENEREIIMRVVEKSVVFVSANSIESVLRNEGSERTAWKLANLYLLSSDAELLAEDAPRIVGLSEETKCYVSPEYFHQDDEFADFVLHEVAHIFHNCKRERVGLPFSRKREFLLDIDFRERETFAYACEAYSRILELADSRSERIALLVKKENEWEFSVDGVDVEKYKRALRAAVEAKNGWKKILAVCAPKASD